MMDERFPLVYGVERHVTFTTLNGTDLVIVTGYGFGICTGTGRSMYTLFFTCTIFSTGYGWLTTMGTLNGTWILNGLEEKKIYFSFSKNKNDTKFSNELVQPIDVNYYKDVCRYCVCEFGPRHELPYFCNNATTKLLQIFLEISTNLSPALYVGLSETSSYVDLLSNWFRIMCGTYFLFHRIWCGYRYLNGIRNPSLYGIRFRYIHFYGIWSIKHHRNSIVHDLLDRKRLWHVNWYLNDLLHCKGDKTRMLLELFFSQVKEIAVYLPGYGTFLTTG